MTAVAPRRRFSPRPGRQRQKSPRLTWTVDKAQKVIDLYLQRRGVLAAHAIRKLEDYRDKRAAGGIPQSEK